MERLKIFLFLTVIIAFGVALGLAPSNSGKLFAQEGGTAEPDATKEPTDSVDLPDPNSEDMVERGAYLVMVAGACQDCHGDQSDPALFTDPTNVALTGGYLFEYEPWGKATVPNITHLQEWSDEAIENSIRYGVLPDGSPALPLMPYEAYANLSDADMAAMIAYLRSVEPVETEFVEPEFYEGNTRASLRTVPEIDPEVEFPAAEPEERGAYLATVVSACGRCHGGVDENGNLDPSLPPTAELTLYSNFGEFNAADLTDLGELSEADIRRVIAEGIKPDEEPVYLMPSHIFGNMTDDDLTALVEWVLSFQE